MRSESCAAFSPWSSVAIRAMSSLVSEKSKMSMFYDIRLTFPVFGTVETPISIHHRSAI